jgi:HD-like signal output (HDOD) protein
MTDLWNRSIAVASINQIVAKRTRLSVDEAFLTGLLQGIGNLYIMARAATQSTALGEGPPRDAPANSAANSLAALTRIVVSTPTATNRAP